MSQSNKNHIIIDGRIYYDAANQPLTFVKLNVDCWEKIFDFLSLRDILAMSETCRRQCKIAGYYFYENFRGVSCELAGEKYSIESFEFEQNDFLQSIHKLVITGQLDDMEQFSNVGLYRSLTTLLLHETDLIAAQVDALKNILNSVACIELYECTMHDNAFEQFLKHCPQLKCLRIYGGRFEPTSAANNLFLQKHPQLQYLHYTLGCNPPRIIPLKIFLEQNRNVKCLETDDEHIWINRDSLIESNVQLDCLAIRINSAKMTSAEFASLLKTLDEHGSFKSLHLLIEWLPESFNYQEFINKIVTLSSLRMLYSQFHVDLSHLIQLKELHVLGRDFHEDFETLAKNLTKLERLHLSAATTDHFLPFIRYSKTLRTVQVNKLMGGNHLNGNTINVFALNRERAKLGNARKVSIGVSSEDIYLATKWMVGPSKLKLIKIVRGEMMEFGFDVMNKYLLS